MEQEISLRDILETIWNGKRILLIITIIAVLFSAFFSFFVLSPNYEVTSSVRIDEEEKLPLLKSFAETLKSDPTLNRIKEKLQLSDEYSIDSLRNSITLSVVNGTQVMNIKVMGSDPKVITNIANDLAFDLGTRLEISERSSEIVQSRKKIAELDQAILMAKDTLEKTKAELDQTPEKVITRQTLADYPFLFNVLNEKNAIEPEELGAVQLETEHVNTIYNSLTEKKISTEIELGKLETNLAFLQGLIKENEEMIEELETTIVDETIHAGDSRRLLSRYNAVFISTTHEPVMPIGPNKALIISGSFIAGIVISLIVIFVRRIWQEEQTEDLNNREIPL